MAADDELHDDRCAVRRGHPCNCMVAGLKKPTKAELTLSLLKDALGVIRVLSRSPGADSRGHLMPTLEQVQQAREFESRIAKMIRKGDLHG